MGCVLRESDEDFIEPTYKVVSFWEDNKNEGQKKPKLLPLLLGAQSNPKLDHGVYYRECDVPGDLAACMKQPRSCNILDTARSVSSSGRKSTSSPRVCPQRALDAVAKLRAGNRHFLAALPAQKYSEREVKPSVSILCCTPPPFPLDVIFAIDGREIACVASASLNTCSVDDCGAAAVEFSMLEHKDIPLVLVIETIGENEAHTDARTRVWACIERLLANSKSLRVSIQNGVSLNAALLDSRTGQIRFLGEHANQQHLIAGTPRFGHHENPAFLIEEEFSSKELMPAVPAEEALAILQLGNLRASSRTVQIDANVTCSTPRIADDDDDEIPGHNPFAIILTSFDKCKGEGPPVEVLFDLRPSKVCAISTIPMPMDGSEETYADCTPEEQWRSHVHLVEQVLATKAPRLLLVLGRAAADALSNELGTVKEGVFEDMAKLLSMSTVIKAAVADGQLQVLGGVYHGDGNVDMPPGQIEWLGAHALQESIVAKMASLYPPSGVLSAQDVIEQPSPTPHGTVSQLLQDCLVGNERFLRSDGEGSCRDWKPHKLAALALENISPKAVILSGASSLVRAPERLFDVGPGEFVVHRTCGGISGRSQGCSVRFLEDLLRKNPSIPLILVLGDVRDPAVSLAISKVQSKGKALKQHNAQAVVEQITPAVVHALSAMNLGIEFTDAQQQSELAELTTELLIRYVSERLLIDSDLVIDRVAMGQLEVQGAVVEEDGRVRMLGGPDVHRLIGQKARLERHRRKGIGLGRARTKGRQFVYSPRS